MQQENIQNIEDYITIIEHLDGSAEYLLYRGQPIKRNLLPSVARKDSKKDTTKEEKQLLKELRRMGNSFLPNPQISDLDLLVMAQHFGMKTRLLDWSANPLAALWFACQDLNREGYVYCKSSKSPGIVKLFS